MTFDRSGSAQARVPAAAVRGRPTPEEARLGRPEFSRDGILLRLGHTRFTVRYPFLLTALVVGLPFRHPLAIASWVLLALAAVVIHECGHAWAARRFGQEPGAELTAMGGATRWGATDEIEWSDRVFISLAGPLAGLGVGLAAWLLVSLLPQATPPFVLVPARQFVWANLGWAVFNLLPLLPLDGGRVMVDFLEQSRGREDARVLARFVSLGVAAVGLVLGLVAVHLGVALLCGLFAFDNLQRIRGVGGPDRAG